MEQKDGQIVELIKKSNAKLQKKDEEVRKRLSEKDVVLQNVQKENDEAKSVIMTIIVIIMKLEQEVTDVRKKFGEEIRKMSLMNLSIENERLKKEFGVIDVNINELGRKFNILGKRLKKSEEKHRLCGTALAIKKNN